MAIAESFRKRFIFVHLCFLLSLLSVFILPRLTYIFNDYHLPPMDRQFRFYIIALFSAIFLFYCLVLFYYKKIKFQFFPFKGLGAYFLFSTAIVLLFLCVSAPVLSSDLYEYSLRGRMFSLYGLNPYLHTPLDVHGDIFFSKTFWRNATECYGPAWVLIGSAHTLIFKNSPVLTSFAHKFVLFIFYAFSCAVFYKICLALRHKDPGLLTFAFFANPLMIIMTLVDGHNEIAMICFLLLAMLFLLKSRYILALAALAVAIQIKFVYALIVPLFALYILVVPKENKTRSRFLALIIGGLAAAAVTFSLWLPFWNKETFFSLVNYYSVYYKSRGMNFWADSIPYAAHFLFNRGGMPVSQDFVASAAYIIFWVIYGCSILIFLRRVKTDKRAIFTAGTCIFFALLFTNPTSFQPWYILWVIPLLLLSSIRYSMLLFGLLTYSLLLTFWKRMSVLALPAILLYFLLIWLNKRFKYNLGIFNPLNG